MPCMIDIDAGDVLRCPQDIERIRGAWGRKSSDPSYLHYRFYVLETALSHTFIYGTDDDARESIVRNGRIITTDYYERANALDVHGREAILRALCTTVGREHSLDGFPWITVQRILSEIYASKEALRGDSVLLHSKCSHVMKQQALTAFNQYSLFVDVSCFGGHHRTMRRRSFCTSKPSSSLSAAWSFPLKPDRRRTFTHYENRGPAFC